MGIVLENGVTCDDSEAVVLGNGVTCDDSEGYSLENDSDMLQ